MRLVCIAIMEALLKCKRHKPSEAAVRFDLHVHISRQRDERMSTSHKNTRMTGILATSLDAYVKYTVIQSSVTEMSFFECHGVAPRAACRQAGCPDKPHVLTCTISSLGFTVNAPGLELTNVRAVTRPPLRKGTKPTILFFRWPNRNESNEPRKEIREIGLSFSLKTNIPRTHGSAV